MADKRLGILIALGLAVWAYGKAKAAPKTQAGATAELAAELAVAASAKAIAEAPVIYYTALAAAQQKIAMVELTPVVLPTATQETIAIKEAQDVVAIAGAIVAGELQMSGADWQKAYGSIQPLVDQYNVAIEKRRAELTALYKDQLAIAEAERIRLEQCARTLEAIKMPIGVPIRDGTPCGSANGFAAYWYDGSCTSPALTAANQGQGAGVSAIYQAIQQAVQPLIDARDRLYTSVR